jgi:two-component system sensor histidine kinase UhpB
LHASLGADAAGNLYLLIQEALVNAIRHGKARHLEVRFASSRKHWSVEIFNDGSGFSLSDGLSKGGFGLRSIQQRARALGAAIAFQTQSDGEVSIRLRFDSAIAETSAVGGRSAMERAASALAAGTQANAK